MSRFKKAIKYTETSVSLDEKIAKANKEFEKTAVLLEGPANRTSGIYYADKENPGTDAVMTPVPDPNGVTNSGYVQPSNGYNASDSSTWANAYPNTDWLYNSNDVGGETDRPVLLSPNTPPTGQTIGRFGPGGGLVRASIGHGMGLGYLKPDNTYQMVLNNSYWGTLHIPNDSNRYGGDAPYRGYTDAEWALLQDAYTKMLGTTFGREIKFWDSYSYFWYGSWEGTSLTKKEVAGGARYVLQTGYISGDPHNYESTPATPPTTTVIFRDPLDKVENLPTDRGKFWELLKKLFGISEPPLDDLAGELPHTADEDNEDSDERQKLLDQIEALNDISKRKADYNNANNIQGDQAAVGAVVLGGYWTWKAIATAGLGVAALQAIISSYNPNDYVYQSSDDIQWRDPSPEEQTQDKEQDKTDDYDKVREELGNALKDALEAGNEELANEIQDQITKMRKEKNKRTKERKRAEREGQPKNDQRKPWEKDPNWNRDPTHSGGWSGGLNLSYKPQGEVLTEKNHLRDLREKKREKTKKVADKIIKINIPGPKDHLTVRAIDMLRSYKVSEKEMQEYAVIIGRINQWIRDNPKEYEIWKVRYPANDPRLAELNWRMDQQLKASEEYVDSRFPENVRLFDKLKQKIETNIQVTDPANFKDVKPVVTHKKLLQVSKTLEKE